MSKTQENLATAFAGESQANRKYLAYAEKAENEGKTGLAKLFRVAAEGETVHALNHLRAMQGVKDSLENLEAAISGETYEIEKMYPGFLEEVQEGEEDAKRSFSNAKKVEEVHQKLFGEALSKMKGGEDVADGEYFVCSVCGYPALSDAPEVCPVCGAPREKFKKI